MKTMVFTSSSEAETFIQAVGFFGSKFGFGDDTFNAMRLTGCKDSSDVGLEL